jgi:hypothetical protein
MQDVCSGHLLMSHSLTLVIYGTCNLVTLVESTGSVFESATNYLTSLA